MLGLLTAAGAALIGGLISSSGSSKAANTQVNNLGKGIALEQQAGTQAAGVVPPGRFWTSPGMADTRLRV